jgi:hypothetical protein
MHDGENQLTLRRTTMLLVCLATRPVRARWLVALRSAQTVRGRDDAVFTTHNLKMMYIFMQPIHEPSNTQLIAT